MEASAGQRPTTNTAYLALENRFRRISALGDATAVLQWDLATMMPAGGAEGRSEQLATLRTLRHGLVTDPQMADDLGAAHAAGDLDPWQASNLREMARVHAHATALDERLVDALSRAVSACETAWRGARADDDFARVLPKLAIVLDLVRESAAAKAERLGLAPYDALLDEYEPGGRAETIDRVFADLEAFLPPFIAEVLDHQARQPAVTKPAGPFAVERQRALAVSLMERLGFDFQHGRLDISLHPFCGGTPDDVRITTRYDEADFTRALMGVLHETGHALYERQLPAAWRGQPVGNARGMVMHESQSLLIEMQVCRSPDFLAFAAPLIRAAFDGDDDAFAVDNLHRLYTRVQRSLIRVDADEVTYPAHVILRYRLERAMIAGDLQPADLPAAWRDGMAALIGAVPPDDRLGCLQDIHWYDGAWGYFPTYTLGAMAAAQLYAAARAADPQIPAAVATGDFRPLLAWLATNVHGQGSRYTTDEILGLATGRPLDPEAFKSHLHARYLG